MITITLNGEDKILTANTSLQTALESWQLETNTTAKKFAIAINEQFIPKSNYNETLIQQGDKIELLIPMQGG